MDPQKLNGIIQTVCNALHEPAAVVWRQALLHNYSSFALDIVVVLIFGMVIRWLIARYRCLDDDSPYSEDGNWKWAIGMCVGCLFIAMLTYGMDAFQRITTPQWCAASDLLDMVKSAQ